MLNESTTSELPIPESWDAKLILSFLHNPAFDEFNEWMDAELATLEVTWQHASSPNAWRGKCKNGSRRKSI